MQQSRDASPNQYIVHTLPSAPAEPPDAYERLKHECLRGPEAAALLEKLRDFIDITGKKELEQTVDNYTQQMLLSAVRVSKNQCRGLQATLARMFLDTALPVLAAPHSPPATGFSFLHLSLLPITLPSSKIDYTLLDPKVAQPAFRLNREESHLSIRLPMHLDFL
jgi:hypothetical protein